MAYSRRNPAVLVLRHPSGERIDGRLFGHECLGAVVGKDLSSRFTHQGQANRPNPTVLIASRIPALCLRLLAQRVQLVPGLKFGRFRVVAQFSEQRTVVGVAIDLGFGQRHVQFAVHAGGLDFGFTVVGQVFRSQHVGQTLDHILLDVGGNSIGGGIPDVRRCPAAAAA